MRFLIHEFCWTSLTFHPIKPKVTIFTLCIFFFSFHFGFRATKSLPHSAAKQSSLHLAGSRKIMSVITQEANGVHPSVRGGEKNQRWMCRWESSTPRRDEAAVADDYFADLRHRRRAECPWGAASVVAADCSLLGEGKSNTQLNVTCPHYCLVVCPQE